MGVELMDNKSGARIVEGMMQKYGCLPSLAEFQTIEEFNCLRVAEAIEAEAARAGEYGFTKITLHMDIPDAVKLATALRKR
jgi:hypothetical protein